MDWYWIGLGFVALIGGLAGLFGLLLLGLYFYICRKYLEHVVRIFQEKPLFIIPKGNPIPDGQDVAFTTDDAIELHGCYFRSHLPERKGVILFGLEYGSNCWASVPYCETLSAKGFDVFTFESRNSGASQHQPGYEPLQWVTNLEVRDFQAAIAYLKKREDRDPRGIGFFGISKGGSAGIVAAARDPFVRCFVTDGIFASYTTMVPYMRKWVSIYSNRYWIQIILPTWFYGLIGRTALRRISRARNCRFPHLERAIAKLSPRPLLMIHGGGDTYIKPAMAKALFARAGQPKDFWLVDGAKHNQALNVASEEYHQRVLEFFQRNLFKGAPQGLQAAEAVGAG